MSDILIISFGSENMVKSMTGFGRANAVIGDLDITVEIKSVNHRYFEFSCRMPRVYQFIEEQLKVLCQKSISRGKIEMSVYVEDNSEHAIEVEINRPFVDAYIKAIKKLSREFGVKNDVKASSFINNSEVFKTSRRELPDESATQAVLTVAEEAVKNFVEMREVEGERLYQDITSRTKSILDKVSLVEERSPETVKAYRERLEQRIKEILNDSKIDEQRILTEAAIFADKVAVAEETVRLRSHIKQFEKLANESGPVGKKLDFIVQEMNREANTIGSKAQDIEIAHTVVDIKAEIEKIREQIQNIE